MKKLILFLCLVFVSLSGFARNGFAFSPNPETGRLNDTVVIAYTYSCNNSVYSFPILLSNGFCVLTDTFSSISSISYYCAGTHYYSGNEMVSLQVDFGLDTILHCYIDSVNNVPLTRVNDIVITKLHAPTLSIPIDSVKHVTCPNGIFQTYSDGSFYIALDDSSHNYAWIDVDNTSSYFFTHIYESGRLNNLESGTYKVTAHGTNGCAYSDSVIITQPEPWVDHVEEDIIDSIRCNEPAYVNLSLSGGTPPYTFNWKYEFDSTLVFPDTNELYFPFPGIYYSFFHDANGCLFNGFEMAFIVVNELVVDTIHIEPHDTIICFGDEIKLSAYSRGFGNHTWSVGEYSDSINYCINVYPGFGHIAEYIIDTLTQPKYVKVTFIDENGCETSDSAWVDVYNSNISMTVETPEIVADSTCTVHVSPPGGNLYVDDVITVSNILSTCTFSTVGISTGEHVLKYAGIFGNEVGVSCEDETTQTIQVYIRPFVAEWDQETSVYPNPATNILNLSCTGRMDMTVSITDIAGRVLRTERVSETHHALDVSALSSGIYLLRMEFNDGSSKSVKFVKR